MEDTRDGIKEVDLLALGKKLWLNRKFIIKAICIGAIVGLIIGFSIPKEYTTTIVLMPESQSSISGNMGSLASLAGINLNNSATGDVLASPDLYPEVFRSTPFLKGLFNIKVKDPRQDIDTTLYSYLENNQKATWWSYIFNAPKGLIRYFLSDNQDASGSLNKNDRIISEAEMDIILKLQEKILVSSDKKTGVTTIDVVMQSPEISALLADSITFYFQEYIIGYRTQKARMDLSYSEKLYEEAEANYYKAQQNLAAYVDGNLNVVSARYRTTQERLQNEANIAYSVFNQTAQQLQLAKVKVQDTTPVFTVIQPSVQPLYPSKPSKKLILIGVLFLTVIVSITWVLRRDIFGIIKKQLDTNE